VEQVCIYIEIDRTIGHERSLVDERDLSHSLLSLLAKLRSSDVLVVICLSYQDADARPFPEECGAAFSAQCLSENWCR